MKNFAIILSVILMTACPALMAQEAPTDELSYIPDISLDMRFGYGHDFAERAGRFGGNGLFLDINGQITPNLSYSLNHCLANFEGWDEHGFGNTHWLTLTYENDWFYVSAGKEDVKIGSFEYDTYDMDSYMEMNSLFWNNISPWQWGVSAGWYPAEGHTILAQACNSPFSALDTPNLFAYALGWRGEWDVYESYWTTNMWQFDKGRYVKALNLGNRFHFNDFSFDLEYTTRCTDIKKAFSSDFTLMFAPSYEWEWGRAFAKVGWEQVNEDILGYDFGGDNLFYGAGAEFFPFKEYKDIRLHAIWASNTEYTAGHYLNIGVTWKMNLTDAGKKLFNKIKNTKNE